MSGTFIQVMTVGWRVPYPETTSGMQPVLTGDAGKGEARHYPGPRSGTTGQPSLGELAQGGAGGVKLTRNESRSAAPWPKPTS